MTDQTPMTGPDHVREALRLSREAGSTGDRDLAQVKALRAQVHATLAQTAATVDKKRWNDGSVTRSRQDEQAWHKVFAVSD